MKRLILNLAAAAAVAGPLAGAAMPAEAQQGRWSREDRYDRREDHWEQRDDSGRRASGGSGWDRSLHNGYYYNRRWFYGPPPPAYYGDPYYRPGYSAWRRGAFLPPVYRGFIVHDYPRYRLRPPPRGYAWYRVDNNYLLAAIASGVIFDIVPE
jgi:Ni/Co efflux regulator RcnB